MTLRDPFKDRPCNTCVHNGFDTPPCINCIDEGDGWVFYQDVHAKDLYKARIENLEYDNCELRTKISTLEDELLGMKLHIQHTVSLMNCTDWAKKGG